jgi:hypothetical protein
MFICGTDLGLTHGAEVDSDCRQFPPTADLSFYYFSNPPIPLVVSSVYVALYRCVPCGIFRGTWFFEVVTRARRRGSVARVCRLTPLRSRTTLCLLSLLHHRGRWVSLTHQTSRGFSLCREACSSPCVHVRGLYEACGVDLQVGQLIACLYSPFPLNVHFLRYL